MANREVEARLKMTAVDQASRVIERVGNKIDAIGKKMEAVNKRDRAVRQAERAEAAAASAAQRERAALYAKGAVGAYLVGRAVKAAVVDFSELEMRMVRIGNTAGVTREEVKKATTALFDMAQDTRMPFDQAVEGLDALVTSGKSLKEALSFLPAVLTVAKATGAETADLAKVATSFSNAMGIGAAEMEKAFNSAAQAGNLGAFELKDMARYLPSILPLMRQAGYNGIEGVQRATAMLQTTQLSAGTPEEAATNLRNVLLKMENPQTAKYFKKTYGIDLPKYLDEAVRKGKDRVESFIDLAKQVSKGSTTAWQAIFPDAEFNQGATALRDYMGQLHAFMAALKQGADVIGSQFGNAIDTTDAKLTKLSNSWGNFTKKLGEATVDLGGGSVLDAFSWALNEVTTTADGTRNIGQPAADTQNQLNDRKLAALANDPVAKAYIDRYMSSSGGKVPSAEQVMAHRQSWGDFVLNGYAGQDQYIANAGAAGSREAGQYVSNTERADHFSSIPSRAKYWVQSGMRMPADGKAIPYNWLPLGYKDFVPPEKDMGQAKGLLYSDTYTPINGKPSNQIGGRELPARSDLGTFIGAQARGELSSNLLDQIEKAKAEALVNVDAMMKDIVKVINGTPIPPIKIPVQQVGQLARVNPGVSMPDQ